MEFDVLVRNRIEKALLRNLPAFVLISSFFPLPDEETHEKLSKYDEAIKQECWETQLTRSPLRVRINKKRYSLRRILYQFYVNPLSAHVRLIRSCNNKKCVNPFHLNEESDSVCLKDGQGYNWEGISHEQVKKIKSLYFDTELSQKQIAKSIEVSSTSVHRIISGKCYVNVK